MVQLFWWVYCLDCKLYMSLGPYNHDAGHFHGPLVNNNERTQSDWALRRFLEEHTGHRMGLMNDTEFDTERYVIKPGWNEVTPVTSYCMVFKTDDDYFDEVVLPQSAERGISDGRVGVSVLTLYRPWFLVQCLTSLMENNTRFTLFLTNQGDETRGTNRICDWWRQHPYVEYIYNDPPLYPGAARAKVFKMAQDMELEYIITVDDDSYLNPDAIDSIVKVADEHPEFHAISGFFTNRVRKYLLGGFKETNTGKHVNLEWQNGLHEVDYISNGFRLIRLDPLVLPDENYEVGYTDWDYANQLSEQGLRMAVYGGAGGYHKFLKNADENMIVSYNPPRYNVRSKERTARMKKYFYSKWGYNPD